MASPTRSPDHGSSVAYRMVRAMFVVVFFWVFWRFGGYLVTAMVVRTFGSGPDSDAYFFAVQAVVFLLILAPATSVLIPAFMPVFIEERNTRGEGRAAAFARTVFTIVLLGCLLSAAGLYVWAGPLTETLARGFEPATRHAAVRLLYWLIPGGALMVLFLILRAILNSYKVFSYPSAAEAGQKFIWVAVLAVGVGWAGIAAAAQGLVVGSLAMVAIAAFGLRGRLHMLRLGFPAMAPGRWLEEVAVGLAFAAATGAAVYGMNSILPWFEARFPDAAIVVARFRDVAMMTVVLVGVLAYCSMLWRRARGRKGPMGRFALLAVPLAISAFFAAYREIATRHFQSFTATGVYSDIEGAKKIANFPTELIALALSVAMLPYLCELASRKDRAVLGDIVTKSLRMLAVGFVPLTVLTLVLAEPVVRLVLDRGDRSLVHIQYTAIALQITASALIIYAAERVIMQAFFSLQRMWAPALLGIAGTVFQVGGLLIAIHLLRYDYPVHIFYLVAWAYPVSRAFKNLLLMLVLKRHVRVLPAGPTLVFAGKLLLLSAAVGAAAWFALEWTRGVVTYEQHRLRKVVVDNFEAVPETWFSLDADKVAIARTPEAEALTRGNALRISYKRHGKRHVRLERDLSYLHTAPVARLSFALWSQEDVAHPRVDVRYRDGKHRTFPLLSVHAGQWSEHTVEVGGGPIGSIALYEYDPAQRAANVLFLDDFRLTDQTGRHTFVEDFDCNDWRLVQPPASSATLAPRTVRDEQDARWVLSIPAGRRGAVKPLAGYDLSGTDRLRCNLRNNSAETVQATLDFDTDAGPKTRSVELEPGEWQRVTVTREQLGVNQAAWGGIRSLRIGAPAAQDGIWIDDVTFRREPGGRPYALAMLLHCTVPTLAGFVVLAAGLVLLRFNELGYVVQWVRDRGWRRRKGQSGDDGGDGREDRAGE